MLLILLQTKRVEGRCYILRGSVGVRKPVSIVFRGKIIRRWLEKEREGVKEHVYTHSDPGNLISIHKLGRRVEAFVGVEGWELVGQIEGQGYMVEGAGGSVHRDGYWSGYNMEKYDSRRVL